MNYKVGPQPGRSLFMSEVPNNRKGPQAREPSKCLNGQNYRGRLAKEVFWSPATRGSKKRLIGPHLLWWRKSVCLHIWHPQVAELPSHSTLTRAVLPQAKKKKKNIWKHIGQYRFPYPSRALYFCCPSRQLLWVPGAARTPVPQAAAYLRTWPSQEQTQVLQGRLRSKAQWTTHMQRRK